MKKNKRVWLIIIPILAILAFMLKDSFTQKSIEDLPGDFKEVKVASFAYMRFQSVIQRKQTIRHVLICSL
jgi:hypothetical protein